MLDVVPLVFGQDVSGVCRVEDQNAVADLDAAGSDDPFAVCVHAWRGVDVEEVRGEDTAGLAGQELLPGRTGSTRSGIDAS
ncbi:hypothetical protein [Actinocrispum wychmicini]|uniref:hypothetical protein n=1 Tax=Actinocrispum wychmicini TaxID=1213861 RepID=UPI001FB81288|nr:hypothetical protein [Actinocrispum wychmicini]